MMKYAGITVGPIGDTISNATSPAALWFASTFFSDITRRLCMKLKEKYSEKESVLLSPYFDKEDERGFQDGVGKYHDRIFFKASDIQADDLKEIAADVKKEVIGNFGEDYVMNQNKKEQAETFLKTYLQIHFIIVDEGEIGNDNCILKLSPYLDVLELMKTFPVSDRSNPFRKLMEGEEKSGIKKNERIKNSNLFKNIGRKNPLLSKKGNNIRDIQEIAQGKNRDSSYDKYLSYYAVVYADADGMGSFLKGISEEDTRKFSEGCLSYDKTAAARINGYGGMTIYAGGDDLLFLAPLMGCGETGNEETIFDLCKEISDAFTEEISSRVKAVQGLTIPTVSFGISAQYYKYPLYEALDRSRQCLFGKAKQYTFQGKSGNMAKNCIYFHLEKHSGQSAGILIGNEALDVHKELLADMLAAKKAGTDGMDEKMVKSLGAKLYEHKHMIKTMDDSYKKGERGKPFWTNLFDNEGQVSGKEFREKVEKWYYSNLIDGGKRIAIIENGGEFESLLAVLRINKFFLEKGDDNK